MIWRRRVAFGHTRRFACSGSLAKVSFMKGSFRPAATSFPAVIGSCIRDYYGLRQADFVVMDGLQGLQHGPLPAWDGSGTYDYSSSIMNMRVVLAGENAVAVDSVAASIMKCLPARVPFLSALHSAGMGPTDLGAITVIGQKVREVAKAFQGKQHDICPGTRAAGTVSLSVDGGGWRTTPATRRTLVQRSLAQRTPTTPW